MSGSFHLRDIDPSDLLHIHRGLSDPRVTQYYGVHFNSLDETSEQMKWYHDQVLEKKGKWWIISNELGLPVGAAGFNDHNRDTGDMEIGFWLYPEYRGLGIMKAMMPELIARSSLFPTVSRIIAYVEGENIASSSLLLRSGFTEGPSFTEAKGDNTINVNTFYFEIREK